MPLLKGRSHHTKVYRPPGAKYAEASVTHGIQSERGIRTTTHIVAGVAIDQATRAFVAEFGEHPDPELLVIEVVFDSFGAKATVFEIPDPDA